MPVDPGFQASTRHADLGEGFFDVVSPARFPQAVIRLRNQDWARRIGLANLSDAEWIAHFARFEPLPGSFPAPLALRYHGHQFRHYNPDLGDGRGFLFAQMHDLQDGRLLDLGTKGSGTTPWSRGGDGRLTLKGGVREALATAMLEAMGVDTSKTLSLIETGEALHRGDEPSPTRSAVLVRLNHSHIRIGSFQRLAYLDQPALLQRLLDHSIRTHMPALWHDDLAVRAAAFLGEVARRVARTGANWMAAGFVHGVLNTDNINITGESFDYGPWRFLPTYEPGFTAAYFDHNGLYAYGRQPETLLWNLTRLGGCLLKLAPQEALENALAPFWFWLQADVAAAIVRRLGLSSMGPEQDAGLARVFTAFLEESQAPFEQTFFDWFGNHPNRAARSPSAEHYTTPVFAPVREALSGYASRPVDDPYFAGRPCTLLVEDVEAVWEPIAERDDWTAFESKLKQIKEAVLF